VNRLALIAVSHYEARRKRGAGPLFLRRAETNRAFPLRARQSAPVRANTAAAKWIDDIDFVGIPDRFLLDSALPLWTNRS
jgi:hypothetical protein